MWLDSLILLPLLLDSIDKLFVPKKHYFLPNWNYFLLWFTNFYTGFMTLFFGLLYFISKLINYSFQKEDYFPILYKSFLGTTLAACVLLPTFLKY